MENRRFKAALGRIVAERTLTWVSSGNRSIRVLIGTPYKDGSHWMCPFLLEGLPDARVQRVGGVDSLQAVVMAVEGARSILEQSGENFIFLDPSEGISIPRYIPTGFGKQFQERMERTIEREIKRVWLASVRAKKQKIAEMQANLKARGVSRENIQKRFKKRNDALTKRESELMALKPGWNSKRDSKK